MANGEPPELRRKRKKSHAKNDNVVSVLFNIDERMARGPGDPIVDDEDTEISMLYLVNVLSNVESFGRCGIRTSCFGCRIICCVPFFIKNDENHVRFG
jgi:hypothetical protein